MTTNGSPRHRPSTPLATARSQERKPEEGAPFRERINRIATHPRKGARLIARTFYRELRRAGWADQDIMTVADELLGCLIAGLQEYRLKKEIPVDHSAEPR